MLQDWCCGPHLLSSSEQLPLELLHLRLNVILLDINELELSLEGLHVLVDVLGLGCGGGKRGGDVLGSLMEIKER